MVDPLGSAASVTALFQFCIQSFNFIQEIRHYDTNIRKLSIRLSIEKCRLHAWGESVGLTQTHTTEGPVALERCKFLTTVEKALGLILELLDSSEHTRDKYGCRKIRYPDQYAVGHYQDSSLIEINHSFDDFQIATSNTKPGVQLLKKTYWAIYDRKKFKQMIDEAKELIDGIQEITKDIASVNSREKSVAHRLQHMRSVSSLQMIADVCRDDYPAISDALSCRAELLSQPSTRQNIISDWSNSIDPSDGHDKRDLCIAAMENMTVTELKHSLASLLHYHDRFATESKASGSSNEEIVLYEDHESGSSEAGEQLQLPFSPNPNCLPSSSVNSRREQEPIQRSSCKIVDHRDTLEPSATHPVLASICLPKKCNPSTTLVDCASVSKTLQMYPSEFYNDEVRTWEPELKRIVQVELRNQDFNPENDAIAEWFGTLDDDEKNAVVLRLSAYLDVTQTLFLSAILNRKANLIVDRFYGKQQNRYKAGLNGSDADHENHGKREQEEEELRLTF